MKQQRCTADDLGLATWAPSGGPVDGGRALGSLADTLGEFVPASARRIVVPAQRSSTLIEVVR